MNRYAVACIFGFLSIEGGVFNSAVGAVDQVIPSEPPALEWVQFRSAGYPDQVSGMIFDDAHPTCCGLGLGGISTGCLELDVNGTIGFDTIFQSYPRKLERCAPFLGLSVNDRTYVLASPEIVHGGIFQGCQDPARDPYTGPRKWLTSVAPIEGVESAKHIRYFGHYPTVNYQYELDAPLSVGLRAWSAFVPGDVAASSIPAIVFEVHLSNLSDHDQKGTLALNYPGLQMPTEKNTRWADAADKGDFLLKPGAAPFDGKILPETQLQFARPNPGRTVGGKMVIGDPSGDGRKELVIGLRDARTRRGFLVSFQRTSKGYGGRMDGKGQYETEVIDILTNNDFTAVALGDIDGNGRQEIIAGTLDGEVFVYRRKNPGFKGGSIEPLAQYERQRLNPSQNDGGHVSEIRIGDIDGNGKGDIFYTLGYKSPTSHTKPGAYWIHGGTVNTICADSGSEFLGCAVGHFTGSKKLEICVASKSGSEQNNWVRMFTPEVNGQISGYETALKLPPNHGPQWLATGDFNGDGRDDLLVGTIGSGTLWIQRNDDSFGSKQAWSQPEVASAQDFAAYSDPVKGYPGDPKTVVAVGGQNTMLLGRLDGQEVPPGKGTAWGLERYQLGPHQGPNDSSLPAVGLGDLSGDGVFDLITWNENGELTGVTLEGRKFFDVQRPKTLGRRIESQPQATVVSLPFGEQYSIALLDGKHGRFGGDLGKTPRGWADIAKTLPPTDSLDTGSSAAVDFDVAPHESIVLRFALTWYVPQWRSTYTYTRKNITRYRDVTDVNQQMNHDHAELWGRISRWQNVIDQAAELPIELRDALINSLGLIPQDSYWAEAQPPLGDWCFPDGLFGMIESPRAAPQIECIPCTWYGNFPLLYFFPDLMRSTLRGYKEYQRAGDGAMAFNFAPRDEMWWPGDHALENQIALNGFCFVDLVDRQWLRTGDNSVVEEFYPAVKAATQFAVNCRPKEYGLVHMPLIGSATEWWEGWKWEGLTTHAGSLNLAGVLEAGRMAHQMGDTAFANQCQEWFDQGKKLLDEQLWNGQTYLLFKDPKSGRTADDIMANQFDAEWVSFCNGLPRVFNTNNFHIGMETVRKTCIVNTGVAAFASKDGKPYLEAYGNFIPEMFIQAMLYMYAGDQKTGLDICKRTLDNLYKRQRYAFDWPNTINCKTGQRTYGSDYYQNMIVWAIPAALAKQNLAEATDKGSLIDRIILAGKAPNRLHMNAPIVSKKTYDDLVPAYIPPTTGTVKPLGLQEKKKQ